jgi:RNA polymerase sigma-70 factor (ECF subfamily)
MADPTIESRFNKIYDSTYKAVVSFITAKCGNTADINDITQETYMEVYEMLVKRGADYARSDKAVVMKIAQQKLSRHYSRMDRLRMFVPLHTQNEDGEELDLSDLEADAFMTEEFVIDKMMLDRARQMIKKKPEDVKRVFYLFYDLDMTIAEIAKQLGMSESNVKHKLYRTLKELRGMLQ